VDKELLLSPDRDQAFRKRASASAACSTNDWSGLGPTVARAGRIWRSPASERQRLRRPS